MQLKNLSLNHLLGYQLSILMNFWILPEYYLKFSPGFDVSEFPHIIKEYDALKRTDT